MEHPGEVTKLWREEKKLTIVALAGKIKEVIKGAKIDKGTISRFEHAGSYHQKTFNAIVAALGHTKKEAYAILAGAISTAPEAAPVCPENNPDHIPYHTKLEDIFHKNEKMGGWIKGNIDTFHSALDKPPESAATGKRESQQPPISGDIFRSAKAGGALSEKVRRRKPNN